MRKVIVFFKKQGRDGVFDLLLLASIPTVIFGGFWADLAAYIYIGLRPLLRVLGRNSA